jgi:uncharacterized membrane protein
MSFQEKRSIASLIATLLITPLYALYMLQRHPQGNLYSVETFRFWGAFFIILIPVTIVSKIAIHILFSILNTIATREEEPSITDERDRLVELKAVRLSTIVFSFGFVVAMVALLLDATPPIMFIILLAAGFVAEIISDLMQFFLYRRGF